MVGNCLGWTGSIQDVEVDQAALDALVTGGNLHLLADHLDLLLDGRMTKHPARQSDGRRKLGKR
jgi:hypothetical protein